MAKIKKKEILENILLMHCEAMDNLLHDVMYVEQEKFAKFQLQSKIIANQKVMSHILQERYFDAVEEIEKI